MRRNSSQCYFAVELMRQEDHRPDPDRRLWIQVGPRDRVDVADRIDGERK
jgi:hypothetical protein